MVRKFRSVEWKQQVAEQFSQHTAPSQFLSTCCPSADLSLSAYLWSGFAVPSSDRRGTKVLNSGGGSSPQLLPDNINPCEVSCLSNCGDHKLWDTWLQEHCPFYPHPSAIHVSVGKFSV